jgi:hypothetical protein
MKPEAVSVWHQVTRYCLYVQNVHRQRGIISRSPGVWAATGVSYLAACRYMCVYVCVYVCVCVCARVHLCIVVRVCACMCVWSYSLKMHVPLSHARVHAQSIMCDLIAYMCDLPCSLQSVTLIPPGFHSQTL